MDEFYANMGEFLLTNFTLTCVLVFCFMTAVAFLALIPITFSTYMSWKATHKPANLSLSIVLGVLTIVVLSTIYPLFISETFKVRERTNNGIFQVGVFVVLFSFVLFLSIPRSIYYYRELAKTASAKHFTLMCFFAFISFCVMSVLFVPTIYLSISFAR